MDANQYHLQLLEGFLTCPGCSFPYNTISRMPKLLSCGHTFCETCVNYITQNNQGRVVCAYCGKPDFRDSEDVSESHHYKDLIEKIMVCCNQNYNHIGEFFSPSSMMCCCSECKESPAMSRFSDWIPTRSQDLGGYYGQCIVAVLADAAFKERVFQANPNVKDRMKRFSLLSARDKQQLYFSILSVYYGQDIAIHNPGPPPPKRVDENGWVELSRFHNIIPEKYCQNLAEVRKWSISPTQNQVEAVTLKPDKRIVMRAISLCKECGDFPNGYIESVTVVEGNETVGQQMRILAQNVRYTSHNKQVEKVKFSQPFTMSALRDYTFKVKYVGQFLYFGNPARRVDPLQGPDGVKFKVSDPLFKGGEHQSGQGALTGPIVKFFYEPSGPITQR